MLDIFSTILGVAKALLGLADQLRAGGRRRREQMAALFEAVSDTLTAVSTEIRAGGVPHGRCAEVAEYARQLPDTIRDEVGDERAEELGATLHEAYNVEAVAMSLGRMAEADEREPHLAQIEEAAGKFRALAQLIRVD